MAEEYRDKLRTTILTNAGRQTFLQIGDGTGTLVYTRAVLCSQSMNDSSGKPLADEIIASYSNLSNNLKDGKLQISPVTGNHFEVVANFDNKNQQHNISFSTIGWYARIDTQSPSGQTVKGQEVLIAISPTTSDSEVLAAGSPDGLSTQVISAALDMTISDAANISMTVNDISYITRAELNAWQTKIEGVISQGYVELPVEDSERQQLHDHDGKALSFKKPLVDHDATLSKQGSAADAYAVGQRINDIDTGLTQLNQEIYKTFDTKKNAQDLRNGILANADANLDQDSKISVLQNRASELENNSQTLHLLRHDGNSISNHSRSIFTAIRPFFVNDSTLTNPNGFANAKATGDAINGAYQQLSHAIGLIMAISDEAQDNVTTLQGRITDLDWKIVDGINADAVTYTSKLFVKNASSVPAGTNWGYLITDKVQPDDFTRITQEWWSAANDQTLPHYYRQADWKGSWTPWVKQTTQDDVTTLQEKVTALETKKPIKATSQDDALAKSKNSNDEYYW